MAGPRKSSGARSTSSGKSARRPESRVDETVGSAEVSFEGAPAESEAGPNVEAAPADIGPSAPEYAAESLALSPAQDELGSSAAEEEQAEIAADPAFEPPAPVHGSTEPAEERAAQAVAEETVAEVEHEGQVVEAIADPETAQPVVETAQAAFGLQTLEVSNMSEVSNNFEAPVASFNEAQGQALAFADASLKQTETKFSEIKHAADEAVGAIETSYAVVRNGTVELNAKALEALKAAANANLDFVKSVLAAKSPSEYVSLYSELTRKHLEALQGHSKALIELAQRIATASVEPIKAQVAKSANLTH